MGDFDRVFNGLRQIGEKHRHLFGRFEVMLRSKPAARILLINIRPFGNANQRIMRLVHVGFGEIDVIGGDQWQTLSVGHFDMTALCQTFCLGWCPVLARVALQFDIKAVGIRGRQPIEKLFCCGALTGLQVHADRAVRSACQADNTGRVRCDFFQSDLRQLAGLVDVKTGIELHQILIPGLVLG